jgi:predicted small metal-binding protein
MAENRERIDCQLFLAEEPCDIAILHDEEELLNIFVEHAVNGHGQRDTPALREDLRSMLREERRKLKAA